MALLVTGGAMCAAVLVPGLAQAAPPGKIAFVSDRDGDREIFVMNADGSAQTQLTFNSVPELDPAWSPNGQQIAFISNRAGVGLDDLWIMNADGSGARQLTFTADDEYSVDWSPDGGRLVFSTVVTGTDNLWLINSDGTGLRQLTFVTAGPGLYGAHFSPDGTRIAFTNDPGGALPDALGLMSSDGGPVSNITSFDSYAPDFTADGKRIVFYTHQAPDGGTDNEVMSIAVSGLDLRQLTSNTPPMNDDDAPSPSRDGLNRIAFRSDRDGNREIFVMNADGSGQTQLTFTTGSERAPDWQPTAICQKKVATIVGTAASETLTGGPGPDIISGQGGKDTIKGLDGKDVICGDAGKDILNGGKGKDILNGGKGKDRTIGGKGKDRCIGGKGTDTAKGCEKEKKIP